MAPPSSSAWVAPFEITVGPETAWATLHEVLLGWPRLEIVAESDTALHAVERSMLLRFRDDLELRLHASGGRIEVRSASRVGRSDFGVNRRRVERLRQALIERGVVRPAGVGTPSEARVES